MQGLESRTRTERIRDVVRTMQGRVRIWTGYFKMDRNGKPDVEFDGEYAEGKRNGHGVLITPDGMRVEGNWRNDKLLAGDIRDSI